MDDSEATRGPWTAVLSDNFGFLRRFDDLVGGEFTSIAVLRGAAAPAEDSDRLPSNYPADDVLYERDDYVNSLDDLAVRWAQAQAVAAALNARHAPAAGGS